MTGLEHGARVRVSNSPHYLYDGVKQHYLLSEYQQVAGQRGIVEGATWRGSHIVRIGRTPHLVAPECLTVIS